MAVVHGSLQREEQRALAEPAHPRAGGPTVALPHVLLQQHVPFSQGMAQPGNALDLEKLSFWDCA